MKKIQLSGKHSDHFAMVDDSDYEHLMQWSWCGQSRVRKLGTVIQAKRGYWFNGKCFNLFIHREVLGLEPGDGQIVDHIDGNPLNNQRSNLRIVTNSQNLFNMKPRIGCSSKYKGVCFEKHTSKWLAQARLNGRKKYLGRFTCEVEAAKAYDDHARKHYGEYGLLNFPHL